MHHQPERDMDFPTCEGVQVLRAAPQQDTLSLPTYVSSAAVVRNRSHAGRNNGDLRHRVWRSTIQKRGPVVKQLHSWLCVQVFRLPVDAGVGNVLW